MLLLAEEGRTTSFYKNFSVNNESVFLLPISSFVMTLTQTWCSADFRGFGRCSGAAGTRNII